ncbi:dermonecrotic toxin domain-containing protein [Pseudomonas sp. NPDC087804]|uniref:dermonecrotic toxin domain-containing protein n=1 Tax=Pseudomonas sp. NPDC087804 TaxID=3364449 RepID=UPI00380FA0D2
MPATHSPLLFPETLKSPGLWGELGPIHGLSRKDFDWLALTELATQALRSQQSPPMLAQRILLSIPGAAAVPLAGCFVLGATPDDGGEILYSPYEGIKKHHSRADLLERLETRLNTPGDAERLLAFLPISRRKQLLDSRGIRVSLIPIAGDIFEDQQALITQAQRENAEAMLIELKQLPLLHTLVEQVMDDLLRSDVQAGSPRATRVSFYLSPDNGATRHWLDSMSLSDAVLMYYRNQCWPAGQQHEFSNPTIATQPDDQARWESAVKSASGKLAVRLFDQLEAYWQAPCADGSSRRDFFAQAVEDQARADLLLKREASIIDAAQFITLHQMIEPLPTVSRLPTIETVRMWEYQANFVELAGSLMISHDNAYLYTPTQGLQVLKDYANLKEILLRKFKRAGHEDQLYGLLSLEERNRFIGYDRPQVTGEVISGAIFKVLFELIITKQRQNLDYALQVFRHSDGAIDVHALVDKALDIRTMLNEQLLTLDAGERWSTRPVLFGRAQPSWVLADKTTLAIKSFADVKAPLARDFAAQPHTTAASQRSYLEHMKIRLAHGFYVGVRGEAELRMIYGTLQKPLRAIVDTVFNADQPTRNDRRTLNGFRPDAWALTVKGSGEKHAFPLDQCVLLTERGGLDVEHSGRVILWTPSLGLEAFDGIVSVRHTLNQRLLDSVQRLSLLENLRPPQQLLRRNYQLGPLQLIGGNVMEACMQSAIDHYLARCEELRARLTDPARLNDSLTLLSKTLVETNLQRASDVAQAIRQQQSLPIWLGMASIEEQQLHLELLEQWHNSVTDDEDYLHGIPSLERYVRETLKSLLDVRFPGSNLEPQNIEIIPNLALAGPARSLSEFALNHVNVAQGTGFSVASKTAQPLPPGLDQQAVRQMLASLAISTDYAKRVTDALSAPSPQADARKQRFFRQLPWQLLQHAHALKLQQRLSDKAFDLIAQVLDMPDGKARATVEGAHANIYPLSLIKTPRAAPVEALAMYVIDSDHRLRNPLVLYAPYADEVFREFASEMDLIAALNTPGSLQDLLIRRAPEHQQASLRSLLISSVGEVSEMTLAVNPVTGNIFHRLYDDNIALLPQLLGSQLKTAAQADWEAAKNLFSDGIKLLSGLLPGKLGYLSFLWQSYKDFKDSAEALQDHHWKPALKAFIAGAIQMVSMGRLSMESSAESVTPLKAASEEPPLAAPRLQQIQVTAPSRTALQHFETTTVALKDLSLEPHSGTYINNADRLRYAAIAGKVYRVDKPGAVWRMANAQSYGPTLRKGGTQLVIDPDLHTVHYGKAMSKMYNRFAADRERRLVLNIEALGMEAIRRKHPDKARMLVQAIDMARYYAFNSLHNLAQLRSAPVGTRLDRFLKQFFDVSQIDDTLINKIKQAIVPVCTALVNPSEDLMNTDRFVIGSNKYPGANLIAFVLDEDEQRKVHFTEKFFSQQLDWYKSSLTEPFNVDGHAQASVLIHEFAHQICNAVDIASLEARRPFSDLIETLTGQGIAMKNTQQTFQREALSLATPRQELFSRWSDKQQAWIGFDQLPDMTHVSRQILDATLSPTLNDARNAFLDQQTPHPRIETILRNADSIAFLIGEMGRQLDPVPAISP